jgi:hypothetical protein
MAAALLLSAPVLDARAQDFAGTRDTTVPAGRMLVEDRRFGQFRAATALDVDRFGNCYVVDGQACTVSRWTLDGKKGTEAGGCGWRDQQLDAPSGVDASLGIAVYVADRGNHRVQRFDRQLVWQSTYATTGDPTSDVELGFPLAIANSRFQDLFILDGQDNKVVAVQQFSRISRVFGGVESGAGRLRTPVSLALVDDTLYVLEQDRIAVFDIMGNYLRTIGAGAFHDATGIAARPGEVLVVGPSGIRRFRSDGPLVESIPRASLTLAAPAGELRDAAFAGGGLLLLMSDCVIIIPDL